MQEIQKETTAVEQQIPAQIVEGAAIGKNRFALILTYLKDLFTPNKSTKGSTTMTLIGLWVIGTFALWATSDSRLIPTPMEIFDAFIKLSHGELLSSFITSTLLALKALFYAIVISYALSTLSTLAFFRPLAGFFANSRFLSTIGLGFVFAQLTANTSEQKTALLVFGITVFLVTGFLGVILDVKKEEYNYAKTLKMGYWKAFYQVVILGKSDLFIEAIRQNFAIAWMMLPMVENLCRADGGVGILLTDQSKYFHLDAVYAIQIILLLTGIVLDQSIGWIKGIVRPDTLITIAR